MMWNNQPFNNYLSNFNPYQQQNIMPQYQNSYNSYPNQYSQPSSGNKQNNIIWVNGKENAKLMQLPPNSTVILLDNDSDKFYIKTTDDIGLAKLRVFSYTEELDIPGTENNTTSQQPQIDMSNYVTKADLQQAIKDLLG